MKDITKIKRLIEKAQDRYRGTHHDRCSECDNVIAILAEILEILLEIEEKLR